MCCAIPTAYNLCGCDLLVLHVLLPLCVLSCVQLSFATAANISIAFGVVVEDDVAYACNAAFGWR